MKVVLLQDVKKLGKRGDVVEVSDGYGRNVLIRRGLGLEGTKSNLNIAAQRQESKKFQSQVAKDEAVIMASQLKKVKIVIPMQSGEDGKVFGSVTPKYISEVLEKESQHYNRQEKYKTQRTDKITRRIRCGNMGTPANHKYNPRKRSRRIKIKRRENRLFLLALENALFDKN